MKNLFLLTLMVGFMPLCAGAQDDMYFSPKKDKTAKPVADKAEQPACHSGSSRDVDEYNRHKFDAYYQDINDSTSADIIDFDGSTPDSVYCSPKTRVYGQFDGYDDDRYYHRMRRFDDDFLWTYDPWLYDDPWYRSYYGYYGPYYSYRWGYRYGWYDPWYDPYYSYWGGWYDPWYYGWHRPYWGTTVAYRPYNRGGITGTANHGWVDNGRRGGALSTNRRGGTDMAGYRGTGYSGSNSTSRRNTDAYNRQTSQRNQGYSGYRRNDSNNGFNRQNNMNQNRDYTQTSRSESSFGSGSFNRGGGGFSGGGRSGGFSGGGRSGGGGHLGGRR